MEIRVDLIHYDGGSIQQAWITDIMQATSINFGAVGLFSSAFIIQL